MDIPAQTIWFCATGRTGIGHLRRCTAIAGALKRHAPGRSIGLVTNAAVAGLEARDRAVFSAIETADRPLMAHAVAEHGNGPVVVDTAVLPGLAAFDRPLVLVLRETPCEHQGRFALDGGRPWDLVIVPNPSDHWLPSTAGLSARRTVPVGWIYRTTDEQSGTADGMCRVLVATGGGGSRETAASLKTEIDRVIAHAKAISTRPFVVVQAVGPRAPVEGMLETADEVLDPGGELNRHFAAADVVLSTAGYNSVLELATTRVPTMLFAIARTFDDQMARARLWGPRLGTWHEIGDVATSGEWLAARVEQRTPRPAWDLGPSGDAAAAKLLLDLSG